MNKRKIGLIYRAVSAALVLFGVLWSMLAYEGTFEPGGWHSLLYYTILSNILVFGVFIALIVRDSRDIIKGAKESPKRDLLPIIQAGTVVSIMLTFLVFWALLAPGYFDNGEDGWASLLTWHNLSVHVLAPILMTVDYFVFCPRGKLKVSDLWWYLIFPLLYLVYATLMGFVFGATYGEAPDPITRFPYGFMNYDALGFMVIPWFIGLSALFIGMSFLLYWLDRKLDRKKAVAISPQA